MLKKNSEIDNFLIVRELEKGGMGTVYLALDKLLNRNVVIKVINDKYSSNAEFVEKLKQEAVAQAQMNHPNIVTVYSFVRQEDYNFIALEYIDGVNLLEYLKENGKIEPEKAILFLKQILRGLNYAHSRNIIHKDIKPSNIIVSNDSYIKIADFGIAEIVGIKKFYKSVKSYSVFGTPDYSAPEVLLGSGGADERADIYSAGVVFYEMLCNRLPVRGLSSNIKCYGLFRDFTQELRQNLISFINKSLALSPDKRFSSAEDMLLTLDRIETLLNNSQ